MDFKTAIYWHQGLFLQPQHLQRQELHQHFLQKPLFDHLTPHFWGVGELTFAAESLTARCVEVRSAQLIFPDATYVEFPGNAVIPRRSFDAIWTDTDQPLDVYLGLHKFSLVAPNVTVVDSLDDAASVKTRYVSQSGGEATPDFYAEGPQAQIPIVTHALQLFFGSEVDGLDDYDLIPIGSLARDNDTVRFRSDAIPPCYALSGSVALQELLRDIRDDLAGRMRQLAEYKSPRDALPTVDPEYVVLMQSLQALNRHVPTLIHLTESPTVHPWAIYGALRQCAGELSTFSMQFDAMGRAHTGDDGLPPYDHRQPYPCFHAARRLINQLLSEISAGPEFRVTLEPADDLLTGAIPHDYFASRNRFFLAIETTALPEPGSFQREARVAAPALLPTIIDHALPGIELMEVSAPPQGVPKRPNTRYFRFEQMSDEWEQIAQAGEVGLFWPDAPDDLRAGVIILKG